MHSTLLNLTLLLFISSLSVLGAPINLSAPESNPERRSGQSVSLPSFAAYTLTNQVQPAPPLRHEDSLRQPHRINLLVANVPPQRQVIQHHERAEVPVAEDGALGIEIVKAPGGQGLDRAPSAEATTTAMATATSSTQECTPTTLTKKKKHHHHRTTSAVTSTPTFSTPTATSTSTAARLLTTQAPQAIASPLPSSTNSTANAPPPTVAEKGALGLVAASGANAATGNVNAANPVGGAGAGGGAVKGGLGAQIVG